MGTWQAELPLLRESPSHFQVFRRLKDSQDTRRRYHACLWGPIVSQRCNQQRQGVRGTALLHEPQHDVVASRKSAIVDHGGQPGQVQKSVTFRANFVLAFRSWESGKEWGRRGT